MKHDETCCKEVGVDNELNMREVARLANVSVATVSRAMRDPSKVSAKTAEAVQKAASQLGYTYNASVGDFHTGRSTVLSVLVPSVTNALFAESLHGIQNVAAEGGYSIFQGTTHYDDEAESSLVVKALQRRVHALILTGMTEKMEGEIEQLARQERAKIVVVWEKPIPDRPMSYVGFDNRDAAERMTRYLIGLGHKRIGLIAGPFSKVARVRHRLEGYRAALESAGLEFDPDLVTESHPDLLEGHQAMESLMRLQNRPTAVFAASDVLAIGAMKAARSLGLSVPADISIAGFDDIDMASYQDPPLTTVKVPAYQIGQIAAQIATEPLGAPPKKYCLDTDLVIRSSTGPCRANEQP